MESVAIPHDVSFVILVAAIFLVWLFSRMAGFRAFLQMTESIALVNAHQQDDRESVKKKSFRAVGWGLLRVLPFVALIVSLYLRDGNLAELFLFVGVFDQIFYSMMKYSKGPTDDILRRRPEDYFLLVLVVLFLLFSFIPATGHLISFGYLSPAFLLAGIKSLYEAPEEIVQTL